MFRLPCGTFHTRHIFTFLHRTTTRRHTSLFFCNHYYISMCRSFNTLLAPTPIQCETGMMMWTQEPKQNISQCQYEVVQKVHTITYPGSNKQQQSKLQKTRLEFLRRRVRFADDVQTHEIPSVRSKQDVWYDNESLKNLLVDSLSDSSTSMCIRGMEDKTIQGMERRRQRVAEVLDAVLEEQINQWENGEYNPERLAQMSRSKSASSQQVARMTGRSDASFNR